MWPLLHSGRPPIAPVSCLRFIKRCASRDARYVSYAPPRPEQPSQFLDPRPSVDPAAHSDLLSSISSPEPDVWHRAREGRQVFADPSHLPNLVWHDTFSERDAYWEQKRQQQLKLEENFVYEALDKHKEFVRDVRAREKAATMSFARGLLQQWFYPLKAAIQEEQQKVLDSKRGVKEASQCLLLLEPDELSILTMHTVLGVMLKGDPDRVYDGKMPFVVVASQLGRAVQAQVNLLKLKHRTDSENRRRSQLNRYLKELSEEASETKRERCLNEDELEEWEKRLIKRSLRMKSKIHSLRNRWSNKNVTISEVYCSQWTLGKDQCRWNEGTTIQLGAILVNLFRESATAQVDKVTGRLMGSQATSVCVKEPVLKHEVVWQRRSNRPRQLGVLSIHPSVIESMESTEAHSTWTLTRSYPMVCPPQPWRSFDTGAYLTIPSRVVRSFDHTEPALLIKQADKKGELEKLYHALTILGGTPWVMNKEVFSVVEQVWNEGGGKLGLPTRTNVPFPPDPTPSFKLSSQNGALHASFSEETHQEEYFRKARIFRVRKKNTELHSLRCDVELKLAVARKFLEEDRLYFPHNIDFRGRAYPIPPHLNHIGNDMCRGLLLFADARPLGKHGLDWLYIQVANLYGAGENKKRLIERQRFGERSLDKILDSANDPLGGLQWWMSGDSPWQLLATCIEIRDALKSENPEEFLSQMHVHQDGSCNGLQHYAALGRDTQGAEAVNLRGGDAPNDVYTGVAKVVERIVAEDAANGHKWAQILNGHINRKLVKQTVMTSVYGVTFVGARDQIANRLKERGWEDNQDLFRVSSYAAKVTMSGLHEMFDKAKDVMHWLASCAAKIAATGQIVSWTTPLGLPVGQPYRNTEKGAVKTILQTVSLAKNRKDLPIMKRRQQTAFSPNYVHSLDATHMMMTAIGCHEQNVTFAGVHDSFWTHAGSVDDLNRILREKFNELHSRPLIKELHQQFQTTYADHNIEFPEVPESGDFDLKEILDATYFFN